MFIHIIKREFTPKIGTRLHCRVVEGVEAVVVVVVDFVVSNALVDLHKKVILQMLHFVMQWGQPKSVVKCKFGRKTNDQGMQKKMLFFTTYFGLILFFMTQVYI